MGRISKALDELRTKCTMEGTHPAGNSVADILECIAEHYEGGGGGGSISDIALERVANYLYKVSFNVIPEAPAGLEPNIGACSSYVSNGKLYRNLDWKYSETAEFIVVTKRFKGMAYIDGLNDSNLDHEKIKKLPYQVVDGINENGIMVATHVLYNDWEYAGSGNKNINIMHVPFLILNNITTLEDFNNQMSDYLSNIQIPEALANMGYLLHFIVSDGVTTYVIEPPEDAEGSYIVIDATSNPKLTNFRWVDRAEVDRSDEDMQTRPTGIERFNAMPCDMADIKFTNAYESPDYLSDFIGEADTTKDSTDEELLEVYNTAREIYLERTRDGQTWQTMHSVVYSPNGMEKLFVQENFDADLIGGGGSGLPDPSDYPDGTVMVAVNGEWHQQDGYGYKKEGLINLLTQDEVEITFNEINPGMYLCEDVMDYAKPDIAEMITGIEKVNVTIDENEYELLKFEGESEMETIFATEDFDPSAGGFPNATLVWFGALASTHEDFLGSHTCKITALGLASRKFDRSLVLPEGYGYTIENEEDPSSVEYVSFDPRYVPISNQVVEDIEEDDDGNYSLHYSLPVKINKDIPQDIRESLKSVVISDGITDIGKFMFYGCHNLQSLDLPVGLERIESNAFSGCTNLALTELPEGLMYLDGESAFHGCTSLALTKLPDKLKRIGRSTFGNCTNLALTELPAGLTSIGYEAFTWCTNLALTELPDGLTEIEAFAFNYCTSLALTELPASLKRINGSAFGNCTNIETLTFKGTPDLINSIAFAWCTNLTDIYVPWSEGEVANAPWGATNATIHYNHTPTE